MDKYPQLTILSEVVGKRVWRSDIHQVPPIELSSDEEKLGPACDLKDGIYIVTVSENTPTELFLAAHLLNAASADERTTHATGFLPGTAYDSAIAVVNGRAVGGVVANIELSAHLRQRLPDSQLVRGDNERRPMVFYVWVHPAHRRRGLGRQLLEAIAGHFGRGVAQLGFRFEIEPEAIALLRSMGIEEVLGCE